ncbi:MAG TPA: N-acetyltransferase [Bacillota bacterium]|nr:N-acetyltransferase [Bacillota bacterium]
MSDIIVTPVTNRIGWKRFIDLPWQIYKSDPNWVPPLRLDMCNTINPKKNPLLKLGPYRYFLAWRNGKTVGRIGVGIDERLNERKNRKEGYLTLFECINDYAVAEALFDTALGWLKEMGMTSVTGPQSPSNGDDYRGLLIKGFDSPPVLLDSYNPSYYPEFFEAYGFKKQFDRYAFYFKVSPDLTERFERGVNYAMKRYGYTVRTVNLKRLEDELVRLKAVIDRAHPEWPDMVPPTIEEIKEEAAKLLPVVDPDFVVIAETTDGTPVGFMVGLPDYNQVLKHLNGRLLPFGFLKFLWYKKKITGGRSLILFVDPDYHKKGVSAALYLKAFKAALAKGYTYGEGGTIHEFNQKMVQDAIGAGGELYKIYRIYERAL